MSVGSLAALVTVEAVGGPHVVLVLMLQGLFCRATTIHRKAEGQGAGGSSTRALQTVLKIGSFFSIRATAKDRHERKQQMSS